MKLWGGRFADETDGTLRKLNDSFSFDRRMYAADIRGSQVYAGALHKAGLLTTEEVQAILAGLDQVKAEFEAGTFAAAAGDEDIHTAVERRLTEIIGPPGGKLHTGRSRNDQVALDLRLWLLGAMAELRGDLRNLQAALLKHAQKHPQPVMPGYTHLQPAQPVLYAHWLMSYFWMFQRDQERLADAARRTAISPLGAGALAGNPFQVDRAWMAAELGLAGITANSLDAVSDRDFAAEFLFAGALLGVHLSRLAEDLILFANPRFGFVRLPEAFTTGSSLMPQKRNPDALELARGKSGRLLGNMLTLLAALKGLPTAYNKDLQEDKQPVFDTVDTLTGLLPMLSGLVRGLEPDAAAMQSALEPSMLATDLADYLVRKGVPFREAHALAGQCVRRAEDRGLPLSRLPLEDFLAISTVFEADVLEVFDFRQSVGRRNVPGGTAPQALQAQFTQAEAALAEFDLAGEN
jgi:argininosuccinate lyase